MYIGIDGGGTKTKTMLMNDNGQIIAVYESGPSSIRTVPFEESISNMTKGIDEVLKKSDASITALFAGLGDVTGDEDGELVRNALVEKNPNLATVHITVKNDVYNAHAGALEGEEGIAIIIGTGSVAFGVDHTKKAHRAGGYSYKEGDLGSAYGLGSQALSLLGKVYDNRIKGSPLTDFLFHHFNIKSFPDMVALYDHYHTRRTDVAALAPFITEYATKNDEVALHIIDIATDELMLMVKAVDQSLNFKQKQLGIIGSLGQADTLHRKMFIDKLKAYDANYQIFNAKKDPAYGACLLAKQSLIKN